MFHYTRMITHICFCLIAMSAMGADWPTYQHNYARTGVTRESFDFVNFPREEIWVYQPIQGPQPAWPEPAPRDYWHRIREILPTVTYDRSFQVVVSNETVVFGSSAEEKLCGLHAGTGEKRWTFYTEGAVRFAPTIYKGNVYAGSDDGWVYCLSLDTGELIWKRFPGPRDQRLPGNGRMMSLFPIRSGVMVENDTVYCLSGLFPLQGVHFNALDANSGEVVWRHKVNEVSPQGYLLRSSKHFIVPTGRTSPAMFDRETGAFLKRIDNLGGSFALVADDQLVYRSGRSTKEVSIADEEKGDVLASFNGIRMIVHGGMAYLQNKHQISCIDRDKYLSLLKQRAVFMQEFNHLKEKLKTAAAAEADALKSRYQETQEKIGRIARGLKECEQWTVPGVYPYSMVLTGNALLVGGDDIVVGLDPATGREVWSRAVHGRAYGLAAANGRIYVSTDKGSIYAFGQGERRGMVSEQTREPYDSPSSIYAKTARRIVSDTKIDKGYCLVLGLDRGEFAYELARQSNLTIECVDSDPKTVQRVRDALKDSGLYGTRITVHTGSLKRLPYNNNLANLVVSESCLNDGRMRTSAAEIERVLRPYGGTAYFGQPVEWLNAAKKMDVPEKWGAFEDQGYWMTFRKGELPGSGEWTHLYAEPGNSACSHDLVKGEMTIQWFGRPGPGDIIDRHHRPMSPLFKNGRVFVPANNKIIALDAYNGTYLWEEAVPFSRRIGVMKDSGQMVLADDFIYIAERDECQAYDVKQGQLDATLKAPQLFEGQKQDWGYLAVVEDRLFGSTTKPGASFYEMSEQTCNLLEDDFRDIILCNALFAMDRHTGEVDWSYKNGVIFNSAIAIGEGKVFFVESRNETAVNDPDGRLSAHVFNESDTHLMALDAETGKIAWALPYDFPFQHIMYVSYAKGVVLAVGTYNVGKHARYGLYAFNAKTGEAIWRNDFQGPPTGGTHGEQWQHPVIIHNNIYLRPYMFDLQSGKQGSYEIHRGGHGCGGISGSEYSLFGRGYNPKMYPLHDSKEEGIPLSLVNRPGCWINIIPAGRMILLPESSSGCTCSYPMQLSVAYAPMDP